MHASLWDRCLERLAERIPVSDFNALLRPLQAESRAGGEAIQLLAPNRFVLDEVCSRYLGDIRDVVNELAHRPLQVDVGVGSRRSAPAFEHSHGAGGASEEPPKTVPERQLSALNPLFIFENFIEGKSNQVARAAAMQVAENPGAAYNPMFIYGGTGLGKTHLMHAIGNLIAQRRPRAKVLYLNSERFVGDMVRALQHNTITEFKRHYRSVDALLIDDIQFLAGKERSQEEFFHTFNALVEGRQQIVLSCDRYPKEVEGLEERLKSRFGWGLTVAVDPPELETRAAILARKAQELGSQLPDEVGFFIAQRVQSNVRDLEGALHRVVAHARFLHRPINLDLAREALRDLLSVQEKLVSIPNIQKTVAEYFNIRVSDLLSARRSRSIARPRQIAMALAKELTRHSLPEIGEHFGGRDHTTVMHAHRKIKELIKTDPKIQEDYTNLLRTLST